VIYTATRTSLFIKTQIPFKQIVLGVVFILFAALTLYAQTEIPKVEGDTITIGDAPDQEIISFGKKVVIQKHAKEVFSFGGDIIVEGKVDGDVATMGGNVIQKEGAFIGGDIIILGGKYTSESEQPLRNEGKQTVMIAMFEEQLRNFGQNPAQILSPSLSWSFLAQRAVSVLFWFIISLALTTISPGAVSRAVARFQLSTLKVFAIGFFGFWVIIIGVVAGLNFLPDYLSTIISLMALILLILGYVFGRVALQMSIGKMVQKRFLPDSKQSETVALLIGVVVWSVLLSVPYLWVIALMILFSASIGLVLTARSSNTWQKSTIH
jgi:hypothetical protein